MNRRLSNYRFLLMLICVIVLVTLFLGSWQSALKAQQPKQNSWQPVASHRDDRGNIKVVWLEGTPYEMGYQHGTLLHDEIATLRKETIEIIRLAGRGFGLGQLAVRRSFPDVFEECRGLADATEDLGLTVEGCMVLAFGDVYQEFFTYLLPKVFFNEGCAQFAVAGAATVDGHLYHGGTLDNNREPIEYWIKNSTVFVRQPTNGIPHVFIGVPGMIWPNSGINAEGISIALDTAHPNDIYDLDFDQGGSNVQIMSEILSSAHTFDEAKTLMENQPRMRANLIMVTDGKSDRAGVFELLGQELAVRELNENGIVYMTNHFLSPQLAGRDEQPPYPSSLTRYERFKQLLEPGEIASLYGQFDPQKMVTVLRDRTNPYTQQKSPLTVFDDDVSPGGNGSLRQVIFEPQKKLFWIAAGETPVPENPFVCFSLDQMLGLPNATACESPAIK